MRRKNHAITFLGSSNIMGNIATRRIVRNGAGPVCAYHSSFPVEDVSGARFNMHKFTCGRFLARSYRYELDTGELAERLDKDTFVIVSTGERFLRV